MPALIAIPAPAKVYSGRRPRRYGPDNNPISRHRQAKTIRREQSPDLGHGRTSMTVPSLLPPGLMRSVRQPGDPPEVGEMWFSPP